MKKKFNKRAKSSKMMSFDEDDEQVVKLRNFAGPSSQKIESIKMDSSNPAILTKRDVDSQNPSSWNIGREYAVIVDAGSSGSRMQIYSWKDPLVDRAQREQKGEKVKVLPTVEKGTWEGSGHDWQMKVEPGLSSFGNHPQDVPSYLKPLFEHAQSIIPSDRLADTPVFVLATAGMRLLPDDQQKAVLQETCSFIEKSTPFNLGMTGCSDHVQIITGKEEGLLGWIAINYLMDGFHFKPSINDGTEGKSTFGFLDMGGASTQIAFEPSQQAQITSPDSQDDLTAVALRMLDGTDVVHNVFVTTFLGFGTNQARERYISSLLPSSTPSTKQVSDPCLPKGLEMKLPQDHALGNGASLPPSLIGEGSFDQCLKALSPLLDKDAACSQPPCLFHGVHVPPIDFSVNHFIGVSEYWFSSNDVFQLGGVYDFVSFQQAAQKFCGSSWESLQTQLKDGTVFGKQVTRDRLEMQCFKAAWMATVLHEGIGLPTIADPGGKGDGKGHAEEAQGKADEKNLFQSVNDVDGLAVSWTLGKAILQATNNIPPLPAKGPDLAPVHGEPELIQTDGKWQDKFSPAYKKPNEILISGKNAQLPGLFVFLAILITFIGLSVCLFFRGRSPKAIKRRAVLRDLLRAPFTKRQSSHGDYTLADMEEGGGGLAAPRNGEVMVESESSGDEIDGLGGRGKRRRRSSGNSILTALLIPLQRLGLALGFKTNVRMTSPTLPASLLQRRYNSGRYPMRHHSTPAPISMSQPSSPKSYSANIAQVNHHHHYQHHSGARTPAGFSLSRPGSRAGSSVLSPRIHNQAEGGGGNHSYFAAWQNGVASSYPSSAVQSASATTSVSARSSRAGSPTLGHSITNGRSPSFARKAWEELD